MQGSTTVHDSRDWTAGSGGVRSYTRIAETGIVVSLKQKSLGKSQICRVSPREITVEVELTGVVLVYVGGVTGICHCCIG